MCRVQTNEQKKNNAKKNRLLVYNSFECSLFYSILHFLFIHSFVSLLSISGKCNAEKQTHREALMNTIKNGVGSFFFFLSFCTFAKTSESFTLFGDVNRSNDNKQKKDFSFLSRCVFVLLHLKKIPCDKEVRCRLLTMHLHWTRLENRTKNTLTHRERDRGTDTQ